MSRRLSLNSISLAAIISFAAVPALTPPALGGVIRHTVLQGESLSAIAKDFYGNKDLFGIVALYNGIPDPTKIRPGTVVKLPYSERIKVGKGESLSIIAKRVWKNAKLYPVLAEVNGIKKPEAVPAGTLIRIPVMVPYQLKRGETLSTVAKEFYGKTRMYNPIVLASGIDDVTRVASGTRLKVPLILVRASGNTRRAPPPSRATASSKRPAKRKPSPSKTVVPSRKPAKRKPVASKAKTSSPSNRSMKKAEAAYRRGDFRETRKILTSVMGRLSAADKAQALRTLAACHYAFGEREKALKALRQAYSLDPSFQPQPSMVNPDLMKLHKKARKAK